LKVDFIVIGDINIDIITKPIKYLEKEVSIVQDNFYIFPGGNAANTAIELSRLGSTVHFIGSLGTDPISRWLIEILNKYNISNTIATKSTTSGITFALTYEDGTRTFIATLGSNKELSIDDVKIDDIEASHLHRAGYWWAPKLIGEPNDIIFKSAKNKGMTTSLGLSWDPNNWNNRYLVLENLRYCDILMLNEKEILGLTAKQTLDQALNELEQYFKGITVIHRGNKGSLINFQSNSIEIPARKIKTINPTGSGDIYDAAFIYGFKKDWKLKKIGEFANACAELRLQFLDKKYPSLDDVLNYLGKNSKES